jgi:hypothetical protein
MWPDDLPVRNIVPHFFVPEPATNQLLEAKHGVERVGNSLNFGGNPTSCSPCFVKATADGIVWASMVFSITREFLPSITDT